MRRILEDLMKVPERKVRNPNQSVSYSNFIPIQDSRGSGPTRFIIYNSRKDTLKKKHIFYHKKFRDNAQTKPLKRRNMKFGT